MSELEKIIAGPEQLEDDEGLAKAVIGAIWGPASRSQVTISKIHSFYYSIVCTLRREELIIKTHQDVVDVVRFVLDRKNASVNGIEDELRTSPPLWLGRADEAPTAAIRLAMQLAFMVGPKSMVSDKNKAIEQSVPALFPACTATKGHGRLDFHFNKLSLRQVGFKFLLTSSLVDHLLLDEETRTIRVFAYTNFLRSCKDNGPMGIYPSKFIEETISSASLFTGDDDNPLQKLSSSGWRVDAVDLEMGSDEPASRELDNYGYWRERLVILHEAYQKAKPRSLKQFWQDKRDSPAWWGFWLAVLVILLTLVFGLIQSITSIIQITAAHCGQT